MQLSPVGQRAYGATSSKPRQPETYYRLACKGRRWVVASVVPEIMEGASTLQTLASHLPLAYEPVALPCSMMKCGDVIYRSTLDPVLRGEQTGPDWRALVLLASISTYLFLPPGVLPAFIDAFVLTKIYSKSKKDYTKEDIILGRQLATGGFGTVYRGDIKEENGTKTPVVVKKAKEFGEAEVWMNERMMRVGGKHCAEFVTALDDPAPSVASPLGNAIWLVWKYEGDDTLYNVMEKKDFPYNLEKRLFNRELKLPKGPRRQLATIRLAMQQLLEAVGACHGTGIVHRDVKPQNCIISTLDNKIKLIDMGAAADLRIGINYAPKEYLLDPRYAPPQQYVMSTQTARPPPAPVAAFLSPVLWRMESPDRFDMYSVGVTLLQMAFPSLRSDNSLIAFRRRLEEKYKWDLREWRRQEEKRGPKELQEGFELLDLEGGAPWELLCSLMAFNPAERPSAADALRSPFFTSSSESAFKTASVALASASRSVDNAFAGPRQMLDDAIMSGAKRGDLTEASLMETLGIEERHPELGGQPATPLPGGRSDRLSEVKKRLNGKDGKQPAVSKPAAVPKPAKAKQVLAAAAMLDDFKVDPSKAAPWNGLLKLGNNGSKPAGQGNGAKPVIAVVDETDDDEDDDASMRNSAIKPFSFMSMLSKKK